MILSEYFNKKYLYLLPIITLSSMYGFNSASMKTLFVDEKIEKTEEIEKIKYKEEYKLVSLIPFYEGEKLAKEDEAIYMEELKMISMQEFDDADSNEKVEEKVLKIEEKIQEIQKVQEEVVVQETIVKGEAEIPMKKELVFLSPSKNKPKVQAVKKEETENKKEFQKQTTQRKVETSIYDILAYEQILIEVDSKTNLMDVKAKINNEYKNIKTYQVSTAKKDIQKPLGVGNISKISLKPTWYPTEDTKNSFKKRGIVLPNAIPYGHKYNYMGAAKINLTHTVNGKNTYRIHGTLNEKTIGTNESAGCIRMRNNEVLELSALLNDFADIKSMKNIKVILK